MSELTCSQEKYTSISKANGGYIVQAGGTYVTTSLQKAIKIVREYLDGASETETA